MRITQPILGAVLAGAILFGTVAAALAAPAVATTNVNVRTGPGTGYAVAATLKRGERVNVEGCRAGWCYVTKRGPAGWVSWQYLAESSRPTRASPTFKSNFGSPPRFEAPRRPDPIPPGASRPGPHRPGNDGPDRPGSSNGPGHAGSGGPLGQGNNDGRGNARPGPNGGPGHAGSSAQRPCAIGAPGFPFCR
jgi:hypothetical protein